MNDDKIRENWIEWMTDYFGKGWSSSSFTPKAMEDSHTQGYKDRDKEVFELQKCNKLLAEINLNNAGKISELEKKLETKEMMFNAQSARILSRDDIIRELRKKQEVAVGLLEKFFTVDNDFECNEYIQEVKEFLNQLKGESE